jgi:hypothetical protein
LSRGGATSRWPVAARPRMNVASSRPGAHNGRGEPTSLVGRP